MAINAYYLSQVIELLNRGDRDAKDNLRTVKKLLKIVGLSSLEDSNDFDRIRDYLSGANAVTDAIAASNGGGRGSTSTSLDLISPFLYTGPDAATNDNGEYINFGLQGIKGADSPGTYYIVGTSGIYGAFYDGAIDHIATTNGSGSGSWALVQASFQDVPSSTIAATSVYGVANRSGSAVNLVGSWQDSSQQTTNGENYRKGFYYTGPSPTEATPDAANFTVVQPRNANGDAATFTYVHSVDGDLAVGGYDFYGAGSTGDAAIQAFAYDPATGESSDLLYPGGYQTTTAYGIWHNGGSHYTVAGGAALEAPKNWSYGDPLGVATLVDYDRVTGDLSHFRTYSYDDTTTLSSLLKRIGAIHQDLRSDTALETHFEGIYFNGANEYTLPATISAEEHSLSVGALARVRREVDGSFSEADWTLFELPGSLLSSNDSVYGDASIGLVEYATSSGVVTSSYAGLEI